MERNIKKQWLLVGIASLIGLILGLTLRQEWGLWTTVVTALASIYAGYLIARHSSEEHYRKASEELKDEASEILKRSDLIMKGLEDGETVKWTKDEQGEIVSVTLQINVSEDIAMSESLKEE